jgi:hypothetical protein
MDAQEEDMSVEARNPVETVLWVAIVGTYAFYLLGSLYVLAPAVAWLLVFRQARGWLQRPGGLQAAGLPATAWVWVACMAAMEVALLLAHIDFELDPLLALKSSIGWAKGWALMALFILIGTTGVRSALLYRAACVLSAQTLVVLPLMVLGYLAGLPEILYVSPLQAIGGPGPEFFDVSIYSINPESGTPRWRLFTPWGPALGFVGVMYFFLALGEADRRWRAAGLVGAVAMVLASGSRLGIVAIPAVLLLAGVARRLDRPWLLAALGLGALLAGLFGSAISDAVDQAIAAFHGARIESSRVRATLGRIAVDRWLEEAVLWGHGVVARGPHLVEYMPIGSHHTWYGLLYVKGLAGFLALALAFVATLAALLPHAGRNETARRGLQILLVFFFYSFGENLEILAYLVWPGLVLIGAALKECAAPAAGVCGASAPMVPA